MSSMAERAYFDYCATTPLHPQVLETVLACLKTHFGNPSSLHAEGRRAEKLLNHAREQVARSLGAAPDEIIFTSGATEANNLALQGVMARSGPEKNHLITSAIEHHATLHTAEALEREGYKLTILPVDPNGYVDPESVRDGLRPETALISIMYVNNETGALQPIDEITSIAAQHGVPLHTDAVQAVGLFPINVKASGIDLLSLSAHKIYGPKGAGVLYIRGGMELSPLLYGGSQEGGQRAGTENVAGIAGLGAAMQLVQSKRVEEAARLQKLRELLVDRINAAIPGAIVNGVPERTAPHVISVSFPRADAEMMLFRLDQEGFAASMGSACNAESVEPSHVLQAMGLPMDDIQGTLRISIGYPTTGDEIDRLIDVLPGIVEECSVG